MSARCAFPAAACRPRAPRPNPTRCRMALRRTGMALAASFGAFAPSAPGRAADAAPEAGPAGGLTAGSILVRARAIGLIPVNQHSRIDLVGGRVVTPVRLLPDLDVTYFLSDHVALSGQVGVMATRTSLHGSRVGTLPIGRTWSFAATGTVQVHALPDAAFNPYVGVGAAYTHPLAYEPARPFVTAMKADPQVGPVIQAGFDYHLGGNWYANVEVKQIFLPTQVSRIGPVGARVKLDMLIVGAGLGYRF